MKENPVLVSPRAVIEADPYSVENLTDRYPLHQELREAGPVVWLSRYEVWAVARHEHVHAVLRDHEAFSSSAGVGLADFRTEEPWRPPSLLLEADPPIHTRARQVMQSVVSPGAVRALRPTFQDRADELVETLAMSLTSDAIPDIAEAFPLSVFPDAVGIRGPRRDDMLAYGDMNFNAFGPANDLQQKAFQKADHLHQWMAESCARDALVPGGMGSALWDAAARGEITDVEAELLVRSLLTAGVDTTVSAIGNTIKALVDHPDQWARLHQQPSLARLAFDEALRLESPVQTFFRTTTRSVAIEDVTIPAGEKVMLLFGAANRDPRRWGPDADRLDITRKAAGHVAFGMGIHQCVGQPIARLEVEVLLTAMAKRFRVITSDGEAVPRINNTLHGWRSLPVRLEVA